MASLREVLADARFPLFALHPKRWTGHSYVAVIGREDGPFGLHTVQLTYFDHATEAGLLVSNIAARVVAGPQARSKDRISFHTEAFVRRFAPPDGRRRWFLRDHVVRTKDFEARERVVMIAGAERGVHWLTHRTMPLEVFDTAIREGAVTDLVIAGWNQPVRDLARDLEPVTPAIAAAFDGAL